ncbi:uncharacterized protein F4807DRAFT_404215 [Annulohypoxylon truncatum]|uniref:uncharacterized protein n=1 Tax=Annulohypoxylon truncatum TaxID=327061 RepID=UPI0020077330|nr:uncharacterized protein F4807DRAFT_404215 [Annulohypoxylon truncatum]KAI1214678.1 hypothetical protein F4807DRAFT_404215 [Annulohypoxylon truncatum]
MSAFSNNLESTPEEHSTTPCTANLSHILGREIAFEKQPRRIQKMILETAAIEGQLTELFQKAKNCNSALACGLTVDYLHLFKEYNSIVHDIDDAFREMNDLSAPPELLVRWAIMVYKTTERMIPAVQLLANVQVDAQDPEQTRRDIDEAVKAIFIAYEPMDKVEEEITDACPLQPSELANLAQMTRIVKRPISTQSSESDESDDESEDSRDVFSDEFDEDLDFPRDSEGYINLDEYKFSTDGGRIILEELKAQKPT